jgi:hypothetical protein
MKHAKKGFNSYVLYLALSRTIYNHRSYFISNIFHVTLPRKKNKRMSNNANPLKAKLNPICHLLALLGSHNTVHVSRIRVNMNTIKTNLANDYALIEH